MDFLKSLRDKVNNSPLSYATKKDKRQVLTLAIGISAVFVGSEIQNYAVANNNNGIQTENDLEFKMRLDSLNAMYAESLVPDTLNRLDAYIVNRYKDLELFDFDPNTVSGDELLKLGFTEKQAKNLLKYRENGGHFTCADDFRKLYGLRTMQFKLLKDHLVFNGYTNQSSSKGVKDSIFKAREKVLFDFDPNTIDEEQMYKLGWSTKQIECFLKLRTEGKKFYVKKDLSTVFFIDEAKYKELEPYIKIDFQKLVNGKKICDLNLADADELESVGFSGNEADKIIKFRNRIGGFYSVWQLSDCQIEYNRAKKMTENVYTCKSYEIKKFNINKATLEELKSFGYFSEKQANAIIKYRNEKGRVGHISDFQLMNAFDDKEIKKIDHYIEY